MTNAQRHPNSWRPVLTALTIWFIHFMVCWAAVEIWPQQLTANLVAWIATPIALFAVGVHAVRMQVQRQPPDIAGDVAGWKHRFAHGAIAISAVAIVFSAVPSLVLLP